jgi:outer membrane protein TolC
MPLAAETAPRTLTLREALELASKLSPDVQQARLRVLEMEAARQRTAASYMPQVSVVVGAAYQTSNLQGIGLVFPGLSDRVGPFRTFNARPVVTQTVLDLGLLSTIRAARARAETAGHDAAAAREATLEAVLEVYLRSCQAASRVRAAEARVRSAEAMLAQTRELEAAGRASKLDLARTGQQFHAERAALAETAGELDLLRPLLLKTIGLDPTEPVELAPPALAPLRDNPAIGPLLAAALEMRSEIRALESELRAAGFDRQAAARERLPKLSFSGDYGVLGAGPDRGLSTYTAGGTLAIPLWTGGRIESDIKTARARQSQAAERLRAMKLQVGQELVQALAGRDSARAVLEASSKAAAAARESLELARLRLSAGMATSLDTVTAQSALAQTEESEIRARYDYYLASARLAHARGDVMLFFEE